MFIPYVVFWSETQISPEVRIASTNPGLRSRLQTGERSSFVSKDEKLKCCQSGAISWLRLHPSFIFKVHCAWTNILEHFVWVHDHLLPTSRLLFKMWNKGHDCKSKTTKVCLLQLHRQPPAPVIVHSTYFLYLLLWLRVVKLDHLYVQIQWVFKSKLCWLLCKLWIFSHKVLLKIWHSICFS